MSRPLPRSYFDLLKEKYPDPGASPPRGPTPPAGEPAAAFPRSGLLLAVVSSLLAASLLILFLGTRGPLPSAGEPVSEVRPSIAATPTVEPASVAAPTVERATVEPAAVEPATAERRITTPPIAERRGVEPPVRPRPEPRLPALVPPPEATPRPDPLPTAPAPSRPQPAPAAEVRTAAAGPAQPQPAAESRAETPPPEPPSPAAAVTAPVRLVMPLPAYTPAAWAAGVEGDVRLRATIDERGAVAGIEVVRGLPHGLTEAAVAAVRRWKFRPATRGGEPVAVEHDLSLRFAL